MDIKQLVVEHGPYFYLIAFAWTFLEGETIVLLAGFAAAQGLLSAPLLLLAAWLGSFSGDQCYFWVGRLAGSRLLRRFPLWRRGVAVPLSWVERHSTGFILSFRFIYGVRNLSSFACGLSAIDWRRFLGLNLLAALLWAASFIAVGYFLGNAFKAVLGDIARSVGLVMLGALISFALAMRLVGRWQRRRRTAQAPPAAAPPAPLPASGEDRDRAADCDPERRRSAALVHGDLGEPIRVLVPEGRPRRDV
jgi:membrane protein DedA with SNARE-associated domain